MQRKCYPISDLLLLKGQETEMEVHDVSGTPTIYVTRWYWEILFYYAEIYSVVRRLTMAGKGKVTLAL